MSSDGYKKYLFDYRYGGAEWGIEIEAKDPQEARERLNALAWARYQGEIVTKVPIPGTGLIRRIAAYLR